MTDESLPPPTADTASADSSQAAPQSESLSDLLSQASELRLPAKVRSTGARNFETLKVFAGAVQTESAFPELLPSWTVDPWNLTREIPREAFPNFVDGWQKTTDLVKTSRVTLDPVKRLTFAVNEAAESRILRCIQCYHLVRLRKLLIDPSAAVSLQESNPGTTLFEPSELALAKSWASFRSDREWDLPENRGIFMHISANSESLPVETFLQYLKSGEDDPMVDAIDEEMKSLLNGSEDVFVARQKTTGRRMVQTSMQGSQGQQQWGSQQPTQRYAQDVQGQKSMSHQPPPQGPYTSMPPVQQRPALYHPHDVNPRGAYPPGGAFQQAESGTFRYNPTPQMPSPATQAAQYTTPFQQQARPYMMPDPQGLQQQHPSAPQNQPPTNMQYPSQHQAGMYQRMPAQNAPTPQQPYRGQSGLLGPSQPGMSQPQQSTQGGTQYWAPSPGQPRSTTTATDHASDALAADLAVRAPQLPLARPTLRRLPGNNTVKAKIQLLLGMVYQPFASEPALPLVNTGQCRVVRCNKCRSYVNPFVKWISNGNRWICNFCEADNETPQLYYYPLDANGERQDRANRPELCKGAVEFVASPDYMSRPPMAPAYLVLMDVTVGSVQSGLVASVCQTLKTVISEDKLPGLERASFGIVTFDHNVHFYTIQAGQSTPHINVVPGTGEPFLPTPEGILADVKDKKSEIITLLDSLPTYWKDQEEREANVSAALQAAKSVLKMSGGKIVFILSTMPTAPELGLNPLHEVKDAKGRTTNRGLPDEVDGLKPASTFFATLVNGLAHSQINVDLIAAPPGHVSMDMANLSQLAKGSGGDFLYYPNFRPQTWGEKMRQELTRLLSRNTGWEGVMRVRISKGWSLRSYSGSYCFRGVDLMMLPSFSEDHTVTVTFDNVDSVVADNVCYLQLALLYSTSGGERRIRVLTTGMPTTLKLPELAQSVDVDAMVQLMTAKAMDEAMKGKLADARSCVQSITSSIVSALTLAHPVVPPINDPGFPLDESNPIQIICLYCAGMLKCAAFRDGKDVTADMRVYLWNRLRTHSNNVVTRFFRPVLFDICQLPPQAGTPDDNGMIRMPHSLRLSGRVVSGSSAYLICDGESLLVWIGRGVSPEWIGQVLGVQSFDQIVPEYSEMAFGSTGSPLSVRISNVIGQLRKWYPVNFMRVVICKQGDPAEFRFTQLLIEDKFHAVGASFFDIWQKFTMSNPLSPMVYQPGFQRLKPNP